LGCAWRLCPPLDPMAPRDLLLETKQAEAIYAEWKRRIAQLSSHYRDQEQQALAELSQKWTAIVAKSKEQAVEIAQLDQPPGENIEDALSRDQYLQVQVLQQTYQEQANARKNRYDEKKEQYDREFFTAITALVTSGVRLHPSLQPASTVYFANRCQPGLSRRRSPVFASQLLEASQADTPSVAETATVPPASNEGAWNAAEVVEMDGDEGIHNDIPVANLAGSSTGQTTSRDSDNSTAKEDASSRRVSFSNRDKLNEEAKPKAVVTQSTMVLALLQRLPPAVMANIRNMIGWRDCWTGYQACQLFRDSFHPNSFPPGAKLAGLLDLEQNPPGCKASNIPCSRRSQSRVPSWLGCYHCFLPQRLHNFELSRWGNRSSEGQESVTPTHFTPTARRDHSYAPPSPTLSPRPTANPHHKPSPTRHGDSASQISTTHRRIADTWGIRRFCVTCGVNKEFYRAGDVIELRRPLWRGEALWVCYCRKLLSCLMETTCSACGMHVPRRYR
jgi:hypothetical protein